MAKKLLVFVYLVFCFNHFVLFSQCDQNLIINGSFDGPVGWSTNADGWTSSGDPDLHTTSTSLFGDLDWSQNPINSKNGGTWQNISTVSESLNQNLTLVPGQRYFLQFEFTSHGLIRDQEEPVFQELTGVIVTIGNQVFETAIDSTAFTWESTCISFIAEDVVSLLTFEGSAAQGYLGLDGVCLFEAEDQITIEDKSLCIGDEIIIEISHPSISEIVWNDDTISMETNINSSGKYWLDITDECGTYREEFEVFIEDCGCKLYTPNTFNPGSQSANGAFSLGSNCELQMYELQIFDRWGNPIFSSTDIHKSWDGTIKSQDAESGMYLYHLTYDFLNNKIEDYGTINLVR